MPLLSSCWVLQDKLYISIKWPLLASDLATIITGRTRPVHLWYGNRLCYCSLDPWCHITMADNCTLSCTKREDSVQHLGLFAEAMYAYIVGAWQFLNEARVYSYPFGNPAKISKQLPSCQHTPSPLWLDSRAHAKHDQLPQQPCSSRRLSAVGW